MSLSSSDIALTTKVKTHFNLQQSSYPPGPLNSDSHPAYCLLGSLHVLRKYIKKTWCPSR